MQTTKIALYEILAYIIPGLITLVSMILLFCMLNNGNIYISESISSLASFLLISYVLGHANQSIGNLFPHYWQGNVFTQNKEKFDIVKEKYKLDTSLSDDKSIKIMLNITSVRNLNKENIMTFIEREGFYRGSVVGLSIFFIIISLSLFSSDLKITFKTYFILMRMPHKFAILIISTFLIYLYFIRYRRFLNYKINSVLDALIDYEEDNHPQGAE